MKKSTVFRLMLIVCCSFLICSCEYKDEITFADNHISIEKDSAGYVLFGYYIGENKNFVIDADYVINKHPECLTTIIYGYSLMCGVPHDGKERERTYQFIFFDEETLGKYTLSEIAEQNIYDDLQILTYDQLHAAGRTVTYSGPTVSR